MLSPLSFNLLTLLAYMVMQSHSAACSAPTPYSYNSNCYPQCPWNSTLVTYLDGTICKTCTHSSMQPVLRVPTLMTPPKSVLRVPITIFSLPLRSYPNLQGHHLQ